MSRDRFPGYDCGPVVPMTDEQQARLDAHDEWLDSLTIEQVRVMVGLSPVPPSRLKDQS